MVKTKTANSRDDIHCWRPQEIVELYGETEGQAPGKPRLPMTQRSPSRNMDTCPHKGLAQTLLTATGYNEAQSGGQVKRLPEEDSTVVHVCCGTPLLGMRRG